MFTLDIVYRIRGIGRNWVCQMTFMHIKLFSNIFMADFNDGNLCQFNTSHVHLFDDLSSLLRSEEGNNIGVL
jgi:hypothetical protein